ncbi:S41 family peptidase [Mycoplasmatota bacterium]|nr:S41 family peptidase [Mycoplasmatota bacterium]
MAKKIITLSVFVFFFLALISCGLNTEDTNTLDISTSKDSEETSIDDITISDKRNLSFIGTSDEYIVDNQKNFSLYYTSQGEVPYVDIESFFSLVEGAVEPNLLNFESDSSDSLVISYESRYLDVDGVTMITDVHSASLDFTNHTMTVSNYDFFSGYMAQTESDYGEGLNYVDADYVDGEEVVFNFNDYDIDILTLDEEEDTLFLMPLHIANIIFMSDIYYQVYYNGDALYGVDTFALSGFDEDIIDMIHNSSYNHKEMPADVKLASYNAMAFIMDYFYGLKNEKDYQSFYEVLEPRKSQYLNGEDQDLYDQIFDLVYEMDDLHTSHVFHGYYDTRLQSQISLYDTGEKTFNFYQDINQVRQGLINKFGSLDLPDYTLIDNDTIALIHLTGFDIDTPDDFGVILKRLPDTVEDVIIDLSFNTGGNLGAVLRIFGYMEEDLYTYHSQNPADGSAVSYFIDSSYNHYDYQYYVMTSGVTFSAANLFASMAKELNIPIIGQDSSGGASSIGAFILPDGSAIMISTNNVLSSRSGDIHNGFEYRSIESGIKVDYKIYDLMSETEIVFAVNKAKNSIE